MAALEATWPPKARRAQPPFVIREGAGGGSRVSAATATGSAGGEDVARAEAAMRALGQTPLFRILEGEAALDTLLETQGYRVLDPTRGYVAEAASIASALPRLAAIPCEAPLAIQREIWAPGGVGPARLAVMARAEGPKTYLLGRQDDRPAGTAFVALHGDLAMLHALEVRETHRRQGVGRALTIGAANWALARGATRLGLLVTEANAPANALYSSLGMRAAPGYHYRTAP